MKSITVWLDGVLKTVEAIKEGKIVQMNWEDSVQMNWEDSDPNKWEDYYPLQTSNRLVFDMRALYRPKPQVDIRPLTAQEWLEELQAGKKIGKEELQFFLTMDSNGSFLIGLEDELVGGMDYFPPESMLNHKTFSDGSICGREIEKVV